MGVYCHPSNNGWFYHGTPVGHRSRTRLLLHIRSAAGDRRIQFGSAHSDAKVLWGYYGLRDGEQRLQACEHLLHSSGRGQTTTGCSCRWRRPLYLGQGSHPRDLIGEISKKIFQKFTRKLFLFRVTVVY